MAKDNQGAPTLAPYKLRAAQDTTFIKFKADNSLDYMDTYSRGDEVKDNQKVLDILASDQASQFHKISLGAD